MSRLCLGSSGNFGARQATHGFYGGDHDHCLLRVPEGEYRIEAEYKGAKRGTVAAARAAGDPERVIVHFPVL